MPDMLKVIAGDTLNKKEYMHTPDTTLREILQKANVDYAKYEVRFDGSLLKPGDINKTLADLRATDGCFLLASIKDDNA